MRNLERVRTLNVYLLMNDTIAHMTLESFATGFWLSSNLLAERPDIDRPYDHDEPNDYDDEE